MSRLMSEKDSLMIGNESTEELQKIINELASNIGILKVLLVSEEGFPIMNARTSEDVELLVSAMSAGIVSTISGATSQLNLGRGFDFIHVQTPKGLMLISSVRDTIMVVLTSNDVKLGLIHYLIHKATKKIFDLNRV